MRYDSQLGQRSVGSSRERSCQVALIRSSLTEVVRVLDGRAFHKWQHLQVESRPDVVLAVDIDRQIFERVVMHLLGEAQLANVVDALRAASGFAGGLDRRKEQGHKDADDRDDDQQFDERESGANAPKMMRSHLFPLC